MKRILILILSVVCSGLALSFSACSVGQNSEKIEANAGEINYFANASASYSCEDDSMIISGNKFIPTQAKEYTVSVHSGKVKGKILVRASDRLAPEISVPAPFKYVKTGDKVVLEAECKDAVCGTVTPDVTVQNPTGQSVAVENGSFTASTEGEYTVTFTAEDASGNKSTETVVVCANDNDRTGVFAPLETKWGSQQFFRHYNMYNEYSTEIKREGELGSTKITFTSDLTPWNGVIFFKNTLIPDLSEYKTMRFWVYNEATEQMPLRVNWINRIYWLAPNEWTEITVSVADLKQQCFNASIRDFWYLEDANGMLLCFYDSQNSFPRFNIYLSNINLIG